VPPQAAASFAFSSPFIILLSAFHYDGQRLAAAIG
jgi:hypothetical protein